MSARDPLNETPVGVRQVSGLIIVLMAATLPHIANLNFTFIGFFLAAASWRLAGLRWPRLLPGKWLLALLMVGGISLVITGISLRDGRLAGTALLVVMLGLKLLELRSHRDMHVSIFLGFFVLLTQFLYNQNLWLAIYLFGLASLLIGLTISVNRCHFEPLATARSASIQLLAAAPMALVLFLFFPRLDAPLWQIEIRDNAASTGMSDHMRMGDIERLSQSEALAFRIRFDGPEPTNRELYWRGPVLWHFDGRTWSPGEANASQPRVEVDPATRIDYEMTMEPSGQHWVFPLDIPTNVPAQLQLGHDLQLGSKETIRKRVLYHLRSHTGFKITGLTPLQSRQGLQLPPSVGPRTKALARTWRTRHADDDAAVVQEALRFFNQENFSYTLSPGRSEGDPVEDFLFDKRRGFCEHYAGSFALLMRLAGIPSRVVIGYQGGTRNPLGDHYSIRQSDAHAWSEVWLKDTGWTRIDPTSAVAPERIEHSIDIGRSNEQGRVVFDMQDAGWLRRLAQNSLWMIDTVELGWYRWVLGFTPTRQQNLLQSLGLSQLGNYAPAVALGTLILVFMLIFVLLLGRRSELHTDPLYGYWQHYRRKLRKAGLDTPHWQGPEELLASATARWPAHAASFKEITRRYIGLRYGSSKSHVERRHLRRQIRRLHIKNRHSKPV